ncbi:hypothetical protein QEZ52_04325 [Aliisedimentitalea scapharcae]|uniref:5-carboxymethyl-2-hydroxymuconate isomerase n=1 Tax=Aliisedimentitalea scapharcae TaxID=1524259 RepID=A0ABZ2XWL4_9RHOB
MPHAEIKYSSDLNINAPAILADIEATILNHDNSAGACKGRAWPVEQFHHTHIIINVSLLPKAHRDAAFLQDLLDDLERKIKARIAQPCAFSLELTFSGPAYVTNMHSGHT